MIIILRLNFTLYHLPFTHSMGEGGYFLSPKDPQPEVNIYFQSSLDTYVRFCIKYEKCMAGFMI